MRDESQLWREIAAATFCSDGVADGWDSDTEEPASNEDKYLKVGRDCEKAHSDAVEKEALYVTVSGVGSFSFQCQSAADVPRRWHASAGGKGAGSGGSTQADGVRPFYSHSRFQANPDVPVVENLEDLWMVSKLQRERKAKEEAAKQRRLSQMRVR